MLGRGATRRVATEASNGSTWYLRASCAKSSFISFSFLGMLGRHVVGLRPVLASGRRVPTCTLLKGSWLTGPATIPRRADDLRAGDPAFVIDGVVAHHLEVLRLVRGRRVGVGLVERVGEAHAFDRASA